MSGIRQHTIPRFLIKGFSEIGKEQYVWMHKKNGLHFKTNINNASVVKSFYNSSENPDVDDLITKEEPAFSALIDRLRSNGHIEVKDYQGIASFIAHLELRTLHIRTAYQLTLEHMLENALSLLDNPEVFEEFLSRKVAIDFENRAKEFAAKAKMSEVQTLQLTKKAILSAKNALPALAPKFQEEFTKLKNSPEKLKTIFQATVKSAQTAALDRSISPEEKVAKYRTFAFKILQTESTLPLGDSAVLFHTIGTRNWKATTFASDQIDTIALPIKNDLILIGQTSSTPIDLKTIPTEIARCSLDYLISKNEHLDPPTLTKEIGKDALPFTFTEMNGFMRSSLGLI